ncbi:tetratricopeptide repeat protein [Rubinisphaera margarita]|uniref:tetratricopeptide repeat protein n=1 Tax=Rubinisphaera margarita TaxID=2909586 RepID=UPI001EE8AE1D|nr:tetratricopeptide repeat protein [Rubinisphaera margarita]MCG6158358.1 tetratricopeptide repeat protein [Rubinisphaera margarita]
MRYPFLPLLLMICVMEGCSQSEPAAAQTTETEQQPAPETTQVTEKEPQPRQGVVVDVAEAMKKIEAYFKQGNYVAAFPLLDQLHRADVCPPEGYVIRAQILDFSGLTSQAISSMTLAITRQPDNAEWHNMLGLLFVKAQNPQMAYQAFTKAISVDQKFAKAYNNRGLTLISQKQFEEAIADFDQATTQSKDYVDAHNNRGYAYLELGEFDKAIENFTRCVEIDPEYVKGYNNRGFALIKLGEPERAIADFTQAIEHAPYDVKHYLHRRDAYQAVGKLQEANSDQQMAQWVQSLMVVARQIQRDQKNPALFVERAELFAKQEKFEEAENDLELALKLDDTFAQAYVVRGEICYQRKQYDKAVEACTKALEFGQNFAAHSVCGDAHMALGQLDKAILNYQAAQRFDNAVALAYWKRSESRKDNGDKDGAEKDRETALKLDPEVETRVK